MDKKNPTYKFTELVSLRQTMDHLWTKFENGYKEGNCKESDLSQVVKLFKSANKVLVRMIAQANQSVNGADSTQPQQFEIN